MNIKISDDPFAGIVLPPLTMLSQVSDSMGESSVAVQIVAEKTQIIDPGQLVKGSKRPMKPNTDSVSGGSSESESQGSENGPINVVGADGTLNAATKHSSWVPGTTYPATLKTIDGTKSVTINTTGIIVNNGTQTARILYADFTKDIQFREMDVCDGGVSKKILVLCSLPYV